MTKKTAKPGAAPAPSFEDALKRLEEIVHHLERAEAPLDEALTWYEEGVKLARLCHAQLKDAERRVELLDDKNGRAVTRPFSDTVESAPAAGDCESDETGDGEDGSAESGDEDEANATEQPSLRRQNTLF